MSTIGRIWWGFLGVVGTVCGTLLIIFDKQQRLRWGIGLFIAVSILYMVIGNIRADRKAKKSGVEKVKQTAGKVVERVREAKKELPVGKPGIFSRIFKHQAVKIGIAAVIGLFLVLWGLAYYSSSFTQRAIPFAEYDFPVWTIRDGDVAVFEKQVLYDDSATKYIVVANTGTETQNNIVIYDKAPVGLAENISDLSFNIKTVSVEKQVSGAVVSKFTIDKLSPQKSKIIEITYNNGYNRMKELCAAVNLDCPNHTRDVMMFVDEETRTQFQSKVEPITAVYYGSQDIPADQEAYYQKIKAQSEVVIKKIKYSKPGPFALISNAVDRIKSLVSSNGEIEEKTPSAASEPTKSTKLTADFFPPEVTKAFILAKAQEINRLDFHCQKITPLKAMVGAYSIPEAYKQLVPDKKTSQKVEIAVYETKDEAMTAAKNCGRGDTFSTTGISKDFPGAVWRDASAELITNPWSAYIGKYENYVIYAPVEAMGLAITTKLLPAIAKEIQEHW